MGTPSIIALLDLLTWGGLALVVTLLCWFLMERFLRRRKPHGTLGENGYSAVVEALSDGVLIFGKDGCVRACNPAAGAILDRHPKDLIGARAIEPGWKVEDEGGRPVTEDEHPITQVLRADKDQVRSILRLESPDGRSRWIHSSVKAIPSGQAFEGALAVAKIRDITAQRQEAQALKAAEQTFRDLFERAPNGVSITRAQDGLVIDANEAWCRLFGLKREEAIGRTLYDLGIWLKPEDRQALLESINQGQVVHAWPFSTRRRDGSSLQVGLGLAELTLHGEACLLAVLQDHSELRQVERDQRKVEKAESLGLMAAGIAHDFNNLFQSLLTSLELAHSLSDHTGRPFLDRAMTSLERASSVSRRLMEFSGGSFTHPEAVSINSLVQEVAAAQMVQRAGIQFLLNPAEDLPLVSVDRKQLSRVLEMLLDNAVEAMGSNPGTVTLSTEVLSGLQAEERLNGHWAVDVPAGPLVRLSIRDSAGGVDRALLNQLFDPYYSTKAPGRGLGLPAASGLLRGNRAGLQVVNHPGEGLAVHIYLSATPKN